MSRVRESNPVHTVSDLALAMTLSVVALLGWATTYDGDRWLVVGVIGCAVGAGVAAAAAGRGFGVDVVLLVLIPVYLLSAGPVASSARLDGQIFVEVIGGTFTSWPLLAGTHPLIDPTGVLLLPPYLVGVLVTGLAAGLAMTSRSPGLPLLPPLAGFATVLVMGRGEPDSVIGHALLFGGIGVLWVVVRAIRIEVRAGAAALATRSALAVVMVGAAVTVAGPIASRIDIDTPRLVVRERIPTYAVSKVPGPLTGFRNFTEQPAGLVSNVHDYDLVTVRGLPKGARIRFATLDVWDQTAFSTDNGTVPGRGDDRFLRVSRSLANPARGKEVVVDAQIHPNYDSQWVPITGALQWFDFEGSDARRRMSGFRFNPATATAVMTTELTGEDLYRFRTVLTDDRLSREMAPWPELDAELFTQAKFVDIPAHAWSQGATGPMDAVFRAAETLRSSGRYSDGAFGAETKYLPGHDRARIGPQFIHGSLTGNDEQYAAVMALVATRLGVPARVVVGAVVPQDGVVQGRDVEAWVELRVDDGSWRTLPTEQFMSLTPPEVDRFDQNPDPNIKLPSLPPQQVPEQPQVVDDEPSSDQDGSGIAEAAWWPWLLAALVVLIGSVPALKLLRRRRRLGHDRTTRRYAGAWAELVDTARDLGTPVASGVTRQAQASWLGDDPRLDALAWEADLVIFGISEPTVEAAADFWSQVDALRRERLAAVPRWRRWLAPFHPGSLRPSRYNPVGSSNGTTSEQMPNGSSPSSARPAAAVGSARV